MKIQTIIIQLLNNKTKISNKKLVNLLRKLADQLEKKK